jgi:hypothetical protein
MIEDSLQHSLEQSLATTNFDPEDLELADLYLGSELRPTVVPGAPAMITVELDPDDLSYVFVNIDPPGEPLVASVGKDPRLTHSVGFDLPPAVALELGTRLRICAEAAARFAEAFPEEPDEADSADGRLATNLGTNSDTSLFPPDQAT